MEMNSTSIAQFKGKSEKQKTNIILMIKILSSTVLPITVRMHCIFLFTSKLERDSCQHTCYYEP
jgi:hypothetical protein